VLREIQCCNSESGTMYGKYGQGDKHGFRVSVGVFCLSGFIDWVVVPSVCYLLCSIGKYLCANNY